ncbi:hypothetical protein bcere0019_2010 [Bacillus cereus Rock3-28]|nr:hypothetical protein bcere0019_2010 [Bacillus cereus Rock3-28]
MTSSHHNPPLLSICTKKIVKEKTYHVKRFKMMLTIIYNDS